MGIPEGVIIEFLALWIITSDSLFIILIIFSNLSFCLSHSILK